MLKDRFSPRRPFLADIKLSPEPSEATMPHRGEALFGMVDDLVVAKVLDPSQIDERLCVPQPPDASFLPLLPATSQGYFVNIIRMRGSGILSRHRHPVRACHRAAGPMALP
jgi:hypothetical protein